MLVGDYIYEGKGVFKRVVRELEIGENCENNLPILTSDQNIEDWLNWKTVDKFWEKVWQ